MFFVFGLLFDVVEPADERERYAGDLEIDNRLFESANHMRKAVRECVRCAASCGRTRARSAELGLVPSPVDQLENLPFDRLRVQSQKLPPS